MSLYRKSLTSILAVSLLTLSACSTPSSNTTKATAILIPSSEVPPNNSAGTV